jgi:hypothetical protein
VPRRDRRGFGPDDEARTLLDQDRHAQWPQRAHALERFQLVELKGRPGWQGALEIQIQPSQVPAELA